MVTKFRTWLTEASIKVGDVYRHKRVIDPATNKPGMRYRITKVRGGVVYYRPVDGGGAQKCDIEEVDKWLVKESFVLDKKVLTPEAIASKHNVPLERVRRALEAGTKVEHEHTSDEETARRIALAHLGERPDYYTRLKKFVEATEYDASDDEELHSLLPREFHERVKQIVAREDFGKANAAKRGRNPKWPYVPIIVSQDGRTRQLLGKAFATREEAIAHAEWHIGELRKKLRRELYTPRNRATRREHGMPAEMPDEYATAHQRKDNRQKYGWS